MLWLLAGIALQYASEALKNDREIVLAAVTSIACSLDLASAPLARDPEMILASLDKHQALLSTEHRRCASKRQGSWFCIYSFTRRRRCRPCSSN
ncbi:MAG: DUF4116 domain-containing protein [Chlamydiia bacterium]|nr:DUF4116 domain-containing protein [Chlamydiia bacterium]